MKTVFIIVRVGITKQKQKAEHNGFSFERLRNAWNYGIWAQAKTSK